MNILLVLIVLIVLFGAGGLVAENPVIRSGGIGLGTILVIVLLILLLTGRL